MYLYFDPTKGCNNIYSFNRKQVNFYWNFWNNICLSGIMLQGFIHVLLNMFNILAHQGRISDVKFSVNCEWVLSCGRDKYFQWHCSETGRRLGGYQASAWCLCLEYPFYDIFMSHHECGCDIYRVFPQELLRSTFLCVKFWLLVH